MHRECEEVNLFKSRYRDCNENSHRSFKKKRRF